MSVYQVEQYYIYINSENAQQHKDAIQQICDVEGLPCTIDGDDITIDDFESDSEAEGFNRELRNILGAES